MLRLAPAKSPLLPNPVKFLVLNGPESPAEWALEQIGKGVAAEKKMQLIGMSRQTPSS